MELFINNQGWIYYLTVHNLLITQSRMKETERFRESVSDPQAENNVESSKLWPAMIFDLFRSLLFYVLSREISPWWSLMLPLKYLISVLSFLFYCSNELYSLFWCSSIRQRKDIAWIWLDRLTLSRLTLYNTYSIFLIPCPDLSTSISFFRFYREYCREISL